MTDAEYHQRADALLLAIEEAADSSPVDIDYESAAGILTLTFPNGSQMVINKQPPLQQIWVASKFNGYHFQWQDGQWLDTRSGIELWQLLNQDGSAQAGAAIQLEAP